jgi:precorrin-2 dehydrogenase/sirohydrochlorin ferrochelatase
LREAGVHFLTRLPDAEAAAEIDLTEFDIVYVADIERQAAERIAADARRAGKLVNVEDVKELCDFHTPAVVRRGELTFAVSTGGLAPGLAGILAEHIGGLFGAVWATRLRLIEAKRRALRALGASHRDIRDGLALDLRRRGWLPPATGNLPESRLDKSA